MHACMLPRLSPLLSLPPGILSSGRMRLQMRSSSGATSTTCGTIAVWRGGSPRRLAEPEGVHRHPR